MAGSLRSASRAAGIALLAALGLAAISHAAPMKLWYDTFEDGNTLTWTLSYTGGVAFVVDPGLGYVGTHSLRLLGGGGGGAGGSARSHDVPVNFAQDYLVRFGFRYTDFHWGQFLVFGHVRLLLNSPTQPILYDPLGSGTYTGHPLSLDPVVSYLPPETWARFTVFVRPSLHQYDVYLDGRALGTVAYSPSLVPTRQFYFEDQPTAGNYLMGVYDEFEVRGMQDPGLVSLIDPGATTDLENAAQARGQPGYVPFHGQYSLADTNAAEHEPCSPDTAHNHRCLVACLHMLFDYYEDVPDHHVTPNPQEKISAAANTNDRAHWNAPGWLGTMRDDGRRAAHFSSATQALTAARDGCPPEGQPVGQGAWGYTWRSLGYSAVDSVWFQMAPSDTLNFGNHLPPDKFLGLIASGYPVLTCFFPPANYNAALKEDRSKGQLDTTLVCDNTVIGHCVLVIGFDNVGGQGGNGWNVPALMVHDPSKGAFIWIPMRTIAGPPDIPGFFDAIWKFGDFIWAAPWELTWAAPFGFTVNAKFQATLNVTYPGPAPLNGLYAVTANATVTPVNGLGLQGGEQPTHNLANIAHTGDSDKATWNLQAPPAIPNPLPSCGYQGYGTLTSVASTSYATYADKLGGSGTYNPVMIFLPPPGPGLGHRGWPYGSHWWDLSPCGSGMCCAPAGESGEQVSALVWNVGSSTPPPGATVTFWAGDPSLTEDGPGSLPIGTVPVPTSLAPGDTARVTAGPWTRPPENVYGEPYFSYWATIDCPGDPPTSPWPQEENNYGVLAEFERTTSYDTPVSMRMNAVNPLSTSMFLRLELVEEEGAAHWSVGLEDSLGAPVPTGTLLPIGASAGVPLRLVVTPTTPDTCGTVHVESYLHTLSGTLVRELGGLTMRVRSSGTTGVPGGEPAVTVVFVRPARSNPFVAPTVIRYGLPRAGVVRLEVFDAGGRRVRTLVSGPVSAGIHDVPWDGRGNAGSRLGPGLYFCRLELAGEGVRTAKLVLLE